MKSGYRFALVAVILGCIATLASLGVAHLLRPRSDRPAEKVRPAPTAEYGSSSATVKTMQQPTGEPAPKPPPDSKGPDKPAPPPQSAGFDLSAANAGDIAIKRSEDTSRSLEDRTREIIAIGKRGDSQAARILMQLGDAHTYFNYLAVQSLEFITDPAAKAVAIDYLEGKLTHADSKVALAANETLPKLAAEQAAGPLIHSLKANRERPDGHEEIICMRVVQLLGGLQSDESRDTLIAELSRCGSEKGWNVRYGSEIVKSLTQMLAPQTRTALTAYADQLEKLQAGLDPKDEFRRRTYQYAISEARAAAAQ